MDPLLRDTAARRAGFARAAALLQPTAAWLLAGALLAAAPERAEAQSVRISAERLRRIGVPDSALARPAPVISQEPGKVSAPIQNGALEIDRGDFAVFRTGEAARRVPGPVGDVDVEPGRPAPEPQEPFFTTDLRLVTPDATMTGAWVLRPVYKIANRLRWQPDAGAFQGAIFLAVEDSSRRGESRPLPVPVRFQLLSEAEGVEPTELRFEHTNLPLLRVDISARTASDSLRVHLVPDFDVNGADVWVPVVPYLRIETTPQRIQGWGVETAQVLVRRVGSTAAASTSVSLTSTTGELEAVQLELGPQGSGAVRLRSAGTGAALLRASAPGLAESTASIVFVWPWVFLLAALAGGLFGGLAAAGQERRSGAPASWGGSAFKGLLAGVLAALAWYALGVNLLELELGVPRQNELAVAAFAALAGFFGVPKMKGRGSSGGGGEDPGGREGAGATPEATGPASVGASGAE